MKQRPVKWSKEAVDDLDAIIDFISQTEPYSADLLINRIQEVAARLGEFASGRPGRVTRCYEKLVAKTRYIIAYQIGDYLGVESIRIIHVIHSSRNRPEED